MTDLPNIKIRTLTSFPANAIGGTGIDIAKADGNFTVNLDYTEFPFSETLSTTAIVLSWDPVTSIFALASPASVGGISDANSDSKVYGRRNATWVDAWDSPDLTGNPTAPNPPAGDNDTSIATTAYVTGVVRYMMVKNYIINGGMMISQENAAAAGSIAATYYPVDMFFVNAVTTGTGTSQQIASVTPSGSTSRLRVSCTATDVSLASTDVLVIIHRIEGYRTADLLLGTLTPKTITIQFGVRAPQGIYCIGLRNNATNRSYVAEYTIAVGEANVDVVKRVTVTLDTIGTWDTTNLVGLSITWTLMAGSGAIQAAGAGVWAATGAIATANQSNFMAQTTFPFELFDVSVTEGTVAPIFMVPDYPRELALCQRYFERITTTVPATINFGWTWHVPKRIAPTTLTLSGAGTVVVTGVDGAVLTVVPGAAYVGTLTGQSKL